MTYQAYLISYTVLGSILRYNCWPAPYSVDLKQNETFVISDLIEYDDVSDVYQEDEIIQELQHKQKEDRFFQLHQWANRRQDYEERLNAFKLENVTIKVPRLPEDYHIASEPIPWQAGFVDEGGNYLHPENEKVYYLNEMAKNLIQEKIDEKREQKTTTKKPEKVEYQSLETEYESEVKEAKLLNDSLTYNETKEEETVKESLKDIIKKRVVKNCTEEEKKGIGVNAMRCYLQDIKTPGTNKPSILYKVLKIIAIWVCVYLMIAIPCYCHRGWCCCCFYCCCKFCRPMEQIEEAKAYFGNNPLGVVHDANGNKHTYKITNYERYAHKRLESVLMKL